MSNTDNAAMLEVLARRRLDLVEQREAINEAIALVDDELLRLLEPGEVAEVNGNATWTVRRVLQYHCVDCMEDDYLATVEDWHKAKRDSRDRTHSAECWRWHQECAEHLIERQRSTAQRVRDACVSSHVDDKGKKVVFLDRIQRALDGAE